MNTNCEKEKSAIWVPRLMKRISLSNVGPNAETWLAWILKKVIHWFVSVNLDLASLYLATLSPSHSILPTLLAREVAAQIRYLTPQNVVPDPVANFGPFRQFHRRPTNVISGESYLSPMAICLPTTLRVGYDLSIMPYPRQLCPLYENQRYIRFMH